MVLTKSPRTRFSQEICDRRCRSELCEKFLPVVSSPQSAALHLGRQQGGAQQNLGKRKPHIPVIDLFAGPGGLGEGFSAFRSDAILPFGLRLSVEKDAAAHQTLLLRSFFRNFRDSRVPDSYYAFLRGEIGRDELFSRYPAEARSAEEEARHAELGGPDLPPDVLDSWVSAAIGDNDHWVLIGGPPCQAYSMAGRARNRGVKGYTPEADTRHYLYKEYLRIVARHWPSVFVMENVKGLISSRVGGASILGRILEDLSDPALAVGGVDGVDQYHYHLYSLVAPTQLSIVGFSEDRHSDLLIECEQYGVPQMRHRVILLGVRDDLDQYPQRLKPVARRVSAREVLAGLPRLRGGLSRDADGNISQTADNWANWKKAMGSMLTARLRRSIRNRAGEDVLRLVEKTIEDLKAPKHDRGGEFIRYPARVEYRPEWYLDPRIGGVCNSSTRLHLTEDLYRYLYAACFASVHGRSPRLKDFPEELLPQHNNVGRALKTDNFADRFRVQLENQPSTTVVSHIAKDGHYYIHYDPTQLRSLTVREAARLQTFPDNYFFCGNRTEQYQQVGNAVPPLLARQIAEVVFELLSRQDSADDGRRAIA